MLALLEEGKPFFAFPSRRAPVGTAAAIRRPFHPEASPTVAKTPIFRHIIHVLRRESAA